MKSTKIYFVANYKVEGVKNYATIKDCVTYLSDKKLVGLDIETSKNKEVIGQYNESVYKGGLDPYLSNIVMVQIGDLEKVFVIDVRVFSKKELKPIVDFIHWNKKVTFVIHNAKFEGKFLRQKYNIRLLNVYDTMLAELVLYNGLNPKVGLADLGVKYLGMKKAETPLLFVNEKRVKNATLDDYILDVNQSYLTPYEVEDFREIDKSTRLEFINIGKRLFTEKQILYGSDDIVMPLLIKERQDLGHQNIIGERFRPTTTIKLQSKFSQVGADMEINGLPLKTDEWEALAYKNKGVYLERLDILNKYVCEKYPKYNHTDLFGNPFCIIDWSSPAQVADFFKELGVCPREKSKSTKKMEYTVGATAVLATLPNNLKDLYLKNKWTEIVSKQTLLLAYLLVRKAQMNITTYGEDFLKYIHPITGRLHPNYRLMLATGRTATTSPNLLAIPNTHRKPFNVEGTNRVMIVNDYSSQESRVLSALCGDVAFFDFFNNGNEIFGEDFHSYTSALVHKTRYPESKLKIVPKDCPKTGEPHPDFTKEMATMRQNTKSVNFGIPYGISPISLHKQLGITLQEATDLMNDYYSSFPELKQYLDKQRGEALQKGYFIYGGRVPCIFIQKGFDDYLERKGEIESIFFSDDYRMLSKSEREKFKENLKKEKPYIADWLSWNGTLTSRLGNKSNNYPIQGVSALQSKTALVQLRELIIEKGYHDWLLCLLLHDEIVSEADEKNKELYSKIQGAIMKEVAEWYCPEVKFGTSGTHEKHWEH